MKTRQNTHIPFLRHDLFGVFAQHLPIRDIARLKQTCQLANGHGKEHEEKILKDPELLLRHMSKMNKQTLSRFLQKHYQPTSPHHNHMQAIAEATPKNLAAVACYSLMAHVEWITTHPRDLHNASLYTRQLSLSSCLQQSLEFMLHPNVDLRTRILMHKAAFYNLRGWQYAIKNYNLSLMDLSWANLSEANFGQYILTTTKLNGTCLRDTKLDAADLRNSEYDTDTIFPILFSPEIHGMHETTKVKNKNCMIL